MICEQCKFWKKMSPDCGQCRRYAPRIIIDEDIVLDNVGWDWALTTKYDWCGEFQAKEKVQS